jgi:Domain of unknown function (DUF4279)
MEYEILANFSLTGFTISPNEMSGIIGINPTKTWEIGDTIGKSNLQRKENGWVLSSSLDKSSELEEQISDLLQQLKPKWANLLDVCSEYDAEISCAVYSYNSQGPSMHLGKEMLKLLAELNAEVDIDYYSLEAG